MPPIYESLVAEARVLRSLPDPEVARSIRLRAGLSRERIAQAVGVSRATVANWETGSSLPRGANRVAYARLLAELADA